ncbi:hypothetical protein KNO15_03770 [Leifsonia shinshuensis]|uniref:hypothetical protein n=1 Tax=Leifsonia shinshuensis TaxID=150026 RepID=UPI001F514B82|nr:hypothetical protein [Leifsonia shinshuensis]MCI0155809.1 hypothetical protein [Leifsonia shinshuensis]
MMPNQESCWVDKFEDLLSSGNFLAAANVLRDAFRADDRVGFAALAKRFPIAGDWRDDPAAWAAVADAAAEDAILYELGLTVWLVDGRESLAIEILRAAIRHGSSEAPAALGTYLLWTGHIEEATHLVRTAIGRRLPNWELAAGALAQRDVELSQISENTVDALATAYAKLESSTSVGESREQAEQFAIDLAKAHRALGEYDAARRLLETEIERGNVRAPILLGNILQDDLDDSAAAAAAFEIGAVAGDGHSAYNLAVLLGAQEDRSAEAKYWLMEAASRGDEWATRALSGA